MAKAADVNKSKEIRDYAKAHRRAKPKAISEELTKQGIEVTPGFVSSILSADRAKKKKGGRRAPRAAATVGVSSRRSTEPSVSDLMKAKALADQLGGVDKAKSVLDTLSQLRK